MVNRRQYVTLIEVMIAMGLISILMTVLMGYYSQIEFLHGQIDRARDESFELRYLEARLAQVIPSAISAKPPTKETEKKNDFYFYTSTNLESGVEGPSLVFTYDNGIDIDPAFCNHVLGRLLVESRNGESSLVLLTWPVPRCTKGTFPPPMKKEILISKVTDISYQFFSPTVQENQQDNQSNQSNANGQSNQNNIDNQQQQQNTTPTTPKETPPRDQWVDNWKMAYGELPVVVKISLKRSVQTGLVPPSEPIVLAYPLPNSKKPIIIP